MRVFMIHDVYLKVSFPCAEDQYILDAAESYGIDYPYASRAGNDSASVAKLYYGKVDQSDGSFLHDEDIEMGYVLLDVAYPLSDCIIESFVEDAFLGDGGNKVREVGEEIKEKIQRERIGFGWKEYRM